MSATPEQIAHIKAHQAEFDELMMGHRDVEEYFNEYAHIDGLYFSVCSDLGIQPKES